MKIKFLDGNVKEFEKGKSAYEIASSISSSLAKKSIYAVINGKEYDMRRPIMEDSTFELKMKEDSFAVLNHSCAHLLATAIKKLYKDAKFGVGPAIEEGFYYDVNPGEGITLTEGDFSKIEKEMKYLGSQNLEFKREEVSKEEALKVFKDDEYKRELINEIPEGETLSLYRDGDYVDFCRGPHVTSTKYLKHFKLLKISGAYWRGNSDNEQLTRIYGVCFFDEKDLKEHLVNLEERAKRDHRKLGKELGLFMISEYGPGFPFWLPNGMILRKEIEDYWYKIHTREGYKFVKTPIVLSRELWETSGHWFNYKENMYTLKIDEKDFAVKPMNCPGGMLVYKNDIHSYKEFPLKVGELGLVHRHEASGALNGLFRVRNFTQDDAHIFMTPDMIVDQVADLIKIFDEIYDAFNLSYHIELSTRPEKKYIGDIETWDNAEKALANACESIGKEYKINPGDGAFYGPKLDFKLRDSMNRIWQCGTIQLDMQLPERFELTYIGKDGGTHRPVMLHRAIYGSIERFIGIIVEHYGGAFPLWMAPLQVKILPVNNEYHLDYCRKIQEELLKNDIRVEIDDRDEKLGYRMREAQTKKVPYQLVIGDNERDNGLVNVRMFGSKETNSMKLSEFVSKAIKEIKDKKKTDDK